MSFSLKILCLNKVELAIYKLTNRLLLVDVTEAGSSFIDLLAKGDDDELYISRTLYLHEFVKYIA